MEMSLFLMKGDMIYVAFLGRIKAGKSVSDLLLYQLHTTYNLDESYY